MAMRHRLSSVVCQELAEAKYAAERLIARIHEVTHDGVVTADELLKVLDDEARLRKEMQEAVVASEQHDLVMARFEYALKAGPDAPPHKFLRQKQEDVWRLAEAQRKAPVGAEARRVRPLRK